MSSVWLRAAPRTVRICVGKGIKLLIAGPDTFSLNSAGEFSADEFVLAHLSCDRDDCCVGPVEPR